LTGGKLIYITFYFRKVSVSWSTSKSSQSNNPPRYERERSRSRENSYPKKHSSRNYDNSSYSRDSREACHSVFVGNLSFKIRESKIREFFSDCGKVVNVRIGLTQEGKVNLERFIYSILFYIRAGAFVMSISKQKKHQWQP
jgi:hypothetical protein